MPYRKPGRRSPRRKTEIGTAKVVYPLTSSKSRRSAAGNRMRKRAR